MSHTEANRAFTRQLLAREATYNREQAAALRREAAQLLHKAALLEREAAAFAEQLTEAA